jgi:hypothetical protein
VSEQPANPAVQIFLPVARFAGHVAASAAGFIALGIAAMIPVYLVKLIVWAGGPIQFVALLSWLENAVLYIDIALYAVTVRCGHSCFWSRKFACRNVLG